MPANKYAVLRYRIIDRCIANKYRPYPSKEDLRRACEEELYGSQGEHVSLSTIDKDIFAMRNETNLGYEAPIAFSKAHKGYYYTDPAYSIVDKPLSTEEIESIEMAALILSQFRGIDVFKTSEDAIDKIIARLKLRPEGDEGHNDYVLFDTAPAFTGGKHLGPLLGAIRKRQVIGFTYAKFTGGKAKEYVLHPYLLKEYRNRWYVVGFNPNRGEVVVFGVDRIAGDIDIADEHFQRKTDFDVDRYFAHSMGITAVHDAPECIRLRFTPLAGRYVQSRPWHESQEIIRDDETVFDVELYLCVTQELVMEILSYGRDVLVMAPESLKNKIAQTHKSARDQYD